MDRLRSIVANAPMPRAIRLSWQKTLADRMYRKNIAIAKKSKDTQKVKSLESDRRVEIDFIEEDEDQLLTGRLVRQAKRLRVPIPHRYKDGLPSDHWYEGNYMGGWNLTNEGFSKLREEIRKELLARHNSRTQWIFWVPALTGVIGALTGLIAVLKHI